ncbi:MAG TPA: permease prefix domain 2-containing transporter, partial [Gemmatimonadaceae bacterium]|nr:permease prefix domain 2-containing transporter [Gemmatimonadaceae bacterium]
MSRPPRLAEWLLARSAHPDDRAAMLGDLAEEYAERGPDARRWYWGQALRSIAPNLAARFAPSRHLDRADDPGAATTMQTL